MITAILSMLLLMWVIFTGCANSSITVPVPDGEPIVIEQKMGGRGCIAVSTTDEGGVDIIVQQDGSSDWAGIRVLPTIVKTALVTFFGDRESDGVDFAGPSDIQGCAGLFE